MPDTQSVAKKASPTPEWLTSGYAQRILDAITFPGDAPPIAVSSPEQAQQKETTS